MHDTGEIDQFQLLEEKIDSLIELIAELRKEKTSFTDRLRVQDKKIADLTEQIEGLKTNRDKARQSIISMLEKIKQIEA